MKRKRIKILTSAILSLMLIFASILPSFAVEEKYYCTATIEDNFSDNEVLVMFTHEESMKFIEYTLDDFPEADAVDIRYTIGNSYAKEYYYASTLDEAEKEYLANYNTCLILTLSVHDKQHVLDVVNLLEQRDDILIAQPNYYYETGDTIEPTQAVATQPENTQQTTVAPTDAKSSTSAAEKSATSDTAVKTNTTGSVQTGHSNTVTFLTLLSLIISAGVIIIFKNKRKI
jgi:hypothetical protein